MPGRLSFHRKGMGTVLRNTLRKTAGNLGRHLPGKTNDGEMVCLCSKSHGQANERHADRAGHNFELVIPAGGHFPEGAYQIALAIREEVLDLEANGIHMIQVDEAALREKLPLRKSDWKSDYLDWAIPAFRLVHSGVKPDTQIHTHMCYSEFTDIIQEIDDMDADVITFEASRSDLTILDALKENHFRTEVGPGVYDIHSPRIPSVEEIQTALQKMLDKLPAEKLWVNPDCGLKTRGVPEADASLRNMVKAAEEIRKKFS